MVCCPCTEGLEQFQFPVGMVPLWAFLSVSVQFRQKGADTVLASVPEIGAEKITRTVFRDGPTTTTTIIFQKSFASDATPKRRLMAHQMKNLCGFSVFHCVEGAFGASSGGTPKMKNAAPRDELKNGRGRGWAVP